MCGQMYLKEFGLVSGKGTSNSKVEFLPSIYRHGLILIWVSKTIHSTFYIRFSDGTESSTVNCLRIDQLR